MLIRSLIALLEAKVISVQSLFYIVSLLLVGFLVPYNDPDLLNGSGSATSPFVIAIRHAQIKGMSP